MCVVSMVGDHYNDKWNNQPFYPQGQPQIQWSPTQAEFDALKREVEEMKALLKRAKEYDERNNEPNCELEEKMATLRKIAELVDISLDDIISLQRNNTKSKDVTYTGLIPICPECDKPTQRSPRGESVRPVYDINGNNINADRNIIPSEWYCYECKEEFTTIGNDADGYYYYQKENNQWH